MRVRMLFAAGLVAAVTGACSDPPVDTGQHIDAELEANLDLALQRSAEPAPPAVVPVASAIEAPRPPEAEPKPQRVRRRPAAPSTQPKLEAEVAVVTAPEPEPQLEQKPEEAEEPTFTVSPWPRTTDVVPAGGTTPADGRAEPEGRGGSDDDGWTGRRPGRGNGPGVIIRGRVGERDPCAIHLPGGIRIGGIVIGGGGRGGLLGPAGVLINERVPRVGPSQNPVIPVPGGAVGFPGRGPVFQRGSLR